MASSEFEQEGQTYNQQLRAMQSRSQEGPKRRADNYTRGFLEQNPKGLELARAATGLVPGNPVGQDVEDLSPAETLKVYARMRAHLPPDQLGPLDTLAAGIVD